MGTGNWFIYALITLLLWGFWGFFYKVAGEYVPYRSVLFYGIIGATIANILILAFLGLPEASAVDAKYALLGGAIGAIGAIFFVLAVENGKIAVVTPVTALYPIVTILLAFVVLNEAITLQKAAGIVFAIAAMVLLGL